jgi:hypothetical protein
MGRPEIAKDRKGRETAEYYQKAEYKQGEEKIRLRRF